MAEFWTGVPDAVTLGSFLDDTELPADNRYINGATVIGVASHLLARSRQSGSDRISIPLTYMARRLRMRPSALRQALNVLVESGFVRLEVKKQTKDDIVFWGYVKSLILPKSASKKDLNPNSDSSDGSENGFLGLVGTGTRAPVRDRVSEALVSDKVEKLITEVSEIPPKAKSPKPVGGVGVKKSEGSKPPASLDEILGGVKDVGEHYEPDTHVDEAESEKAGAEFIRAINDGGSPDSVAFNRLCDNFPNRQVTAWERGRPSARVEWDKLTSLEKTEAEDFLPMFKHFCVVHGYMRKERPDGVAFRTDTSRYIVSVLRYLERRMWVGDGLWRHYRLESHAEADRMSFDPTVWETLGNIERGK